MKNIIIAFVILISVGMISARTRTAVFERTHTYNASPHDSRITAREKATSEAEALLLREIGVLVESNQKMVTINAEVNFTEEIRIYTSGKVQTQIVSGTERFTEDDRGNMIYSATFRMEVDTAALFAHIDNIVRQKQQALADSIAQVNEARRDSLARAQRISDLEAAVASARKTLDEERQRETQFATTKNRKDRELKEAQRQKNDAQRAYDNATNTRNLDRINFEAGQLQTADSIHKTKQSEYDIALRDWNEANQRIRNAESNLRNAETALARERGAPLPINQTITPQPTPTQPPRQNQPATAERQFWRENETRSSVARCVDFDDNSLSFAFHNYLKGGYEYPSSKFSFEGMYLSNKCSCINKPTYALGVMIDITCGIGLYFVHGLDLRAPVISLRVLNHIGFRVDVVDVDGLMDDSIMDFHFGGGRISVLFGANPFYIECGWKLDLGYQRERKFDGDWWAAASGSAGYSNKRSFNINNSWFVGATFYF